MSDQDPGRKYVASPTGGVKAQKKARHDLIDQAFLNEFAKVLGHGAQMPQYGDRNWEKGYQWGLSYAALQRHLSAFWMGEDIDPESGLHHLAHAGFHVMALFRYSTTPHFKQFDSRSPLDVHAVDRAMSETTTWTTPESNGAAIQPDSFWTPLTAP